MKTMTEKGRQIWFWQREVEARFSWWKELVERQDTEGARQAKQQYIDARNTLVRRIRKGVRECQHERHGAEPKKSIRRRTRSFCKSA